MFIKKKNLTKNPEYRNHRSLKLKRKRFLELVGPKFHRIIGIQKQNKTKIIKRHKKENRG